MCCPALKCYDPLKTQFKKTTYTATPIEFFSPGSFIAYKVNEPLGDNTVCIDEFSLCDFVEDIVMSGTGDPFPPDGLFVKEFVYYDDILEELTFTETDYFVGFTLVDKDGNYFLRNPASGSVVLYFVQEDPINTEVSSYLATVTALKNAQVLKTKNIIKKLTFGYDCSKDFVNLKKINDIISILDNYDTRDIVLGETVFNSISYEEIKLLINKIK